LETGYTIYWRKNILFHNPDRFGWRTHRRGIHPLPSRGPSQWHRRDIGLPTQRLASSILLSMVELSNMETIRSKLYNRTPFPWPGLSSWTFHGWTDTGFFSYFHSSYLLLWATGSWLNITPWANHWGAMHQEQADLHPWLIWRATGYSWTWNTNQFTNHSSCGPWSGIYPHELLPILVYNI